MRQLCRLCFDGAAHAHAEAPAGFGVCCPRTGRRFFGDDDIELSFLERVRSAAETSGLFDEPATDWVLLDCELMPSAKAQELLRDGTRPPTAATAGP